MSASSECCVVRYASMYRADHSSRGVLPNVVSECDREASTMRRTWSTKDSCAMVGGGRPQVDTFQLLLFRPSS
jgi:hypothetical protein